jgi:hypothetical protein
MTLILKVTSTNPQAPLSQLLELPLGWTYERSNRTI